MDSSTGSKIASVAVALVATWTTAHADILTYTVTPNVAVDDFRVYTHKEVYNDGTTVTSDRTLTGTYGTLAAGVPSVKAIGTNYQTVKDTDIGTGLLGTGANGSIVVGVGVAGRDSSGNLTDFATNYGSTTGIDYTLPATRTAIVNGDVDYLREFFPQDSDKRRLVQGTATATGELVRYDGVTGAGTLVGTWSVTAAPGVVPEPASMTALALGAVALLRRRRR